MEAERQCQLAHISSEYDTELAGSQQSQNSFTILCEEIDGRCIIEHKQQEQQKICKYVSLI